MVLYEARTNNVLRLKLEVNNYWVFKFSDDLNSWPGRRKGLDVDFFQQLGPNYLALLD